MFDVSNLTKISLKNFTDPEILPDKEVFTFRLVTHSKNHIDLVRLSGFLRIVPSTQGFWLLLVFSTLGIKTE